MTFSFWTPSDWRRARRTTILAATGQITTARIPGNYFFWFSGRRLRVLGLEVWW